MEFFFRNCVVTPKFLFGHPELHRTYAQKQREALSLSPLFCLRNSNSVARVQWPTFFLFYKFDILRLFYKAHSESFPDTLTETICQN